MFKTQNTKRFDLEERTLNFAKAVIFHIKTTPRTLSNIEILKQLVRASGSVGANYIEANEALSKKDFINRIKICRKEAKESRYWLLLVDMVPKDQVNVHEKLIQESTELMKIFGAILEKSK